MKTRLYKIISGILIAVYISSMVLPGAVFATPEQTGQVQSPFVKHEPKRGTNPETGKVSFIGGEEPIHVPGVSDVKDMSPQERAMGMANIYGKEFGLKNPSKELKLLKSKKDDNGKDIVHYQQEYKGVSVIGSEMIVNMNADGELLSISGEVSSDLTLDTRPAIKAQEARKTALNEIANLHQVDEKKLTATQPELWIFDESMLTASTRPVELVWRVEVTAEDVTQPIREMVLVNAQTGEISFHINQVDTQTTTWPVYFDIELDEARGWIYGSDYAGNKIDVISTSTLTLVKSFTLVNGAHPKGIALSPDGSELAIAQGGAASILFLNPDTGQTIASVIPSTGIAPHDVIYGRPGRLYSSGSGYYDYIHVIDTLSHIEVSRSPNGAELADPHLEISSDKNWLYASRSSGSPKKLFRFDVSTDTIPAPTSTAHTSNFSANTYILDTVNNLVFTDSGQVWTSDLKGNVGSTGISGKLAYVPSHNAVAIASSDNSGIVFVSAQNFYTLSTYPVSGQLGPVVAQSDGSKVFVSTSNGMISIDLAAFPPGTPGTLPAGSLPYADLILDETRGLLYGSNSTGHKIDVISTSTLQVVDQIRFNNGARPQGMDLSPDGNELAVALLGASSLAFIDTNTRTISATVIPNLLADLSRPFDVRYGRPGRLYSSGSPNGTDYLHVFDTTTHTEVGISPYPNTISSAPYLTISADKNSVYATESWNTLRLFNVVTDSPTIVRGAGGAYRGTASLLLADNSKIFTNAGQVWLTDLTAQIGSFSASGNLVEIPGRDLVAVVSSTSPGLVTFVRTADFYSASTASMSSVSAVGASVASSDGNKLFVNTNSGIKVLDITLGNPSSISLVSGSPQTVQVTTQFQQPFKVKVQNVVGDPMAGMVVTFTAPSTSASGTFADTNSNVTTAFTDVNGIATSSMFTANNMAGSYAVKATISNVAADFQLTNLAAVTCTIGNGLDPASLFLPYKQYNCGRAGHGVAVGDFNNDGRKDVALSGWGVLLVFLQDSNGNLLQPHVYAGDPTYLAVGDLNGDGLEDIVSIDYYNTIGVYLQRNDGTLTYRVSYPTGTDPDSVAVGDVNSDGRKDVVVSHWNSAVIGVFIQGAGGTLNPMISYPSVTAGRDDIAVGDVNNDGRNDVVKMNGAYSPNLMVYLQNNSGTLNSPVNYSLSGCTTFCTGKGVGIGDLTGDGRQDVVMSYGGNSSTAKMAVFPQDTSGNLQPAISYPSYDIPSPVEIADLNSDNLLDVALLHSGWGRAGTYLQQPDGSLGSESLYVLPDINSSYNPGDLSIGDVNYDGLPDLLIAGYTGLVILYRNTTIPPTPTPTPTYTPSFTPGPTFTPSPTFTPGPGPSPTPRPSSTAGPSPTPVSPSSTGSRRTYTASGGSTLPGTFLCDQNQSVCTNGADLDADEAHQYAADTFVFYNTHHGRNSIDNAGSTITSTVNYGVNYRNAFWNHSQVVYGDDMAADDVVGHEITHGVTEYTSGLIYYSQSGAINESFSDVWGEFIDQTNSSGNDATSVKWLMGEDSALSAIRSMSNPPAFGHPDKMSSPYYYTGSGDNGGVHINSGINNKAAYLMVEGGTFNSRTITGIGLNKTAAVYYEAQVYHLTMGANYNDLYYALIQACQNLIGGIDGITQNDCEQVKAASEAVEMIPAPPATPTATSTITPTFTPTNTATKTSTPTNTFTPTSTPPYSYNPLYLSLTSGQTIGGVPSADEDILRFDGSSWSLFFDGSDVGVGGSDLFGFSFLDADSLLLSFTTALTLNGIAVTPQDVVRFDATSLGSVTTGTFSMYFDGSDVGFDTTAEKIDAVSLLPDGRVLLSTTGNPAVVGVTGAKDEDVLAFTATSLGNTTNGSWAMYFDGSDVGLAETSGEDVDALDVTSNGNIYLSTADNFTVNGVAGADEDVFVCVPTSLGDVTACNYSSSLYFDGSTWGLTANDVDAFHFLSTGPVPTNTPVNTPTFTPSPTFTPTRTPTPPTSRFVQIVQPNGGEVLIVGSTYRITWNSTSDIDTVTLGYKSCDSCLDWIATGVPNVGYYDWNVFVGNTINTQFKIYILGYDTGVGSWSDVSDNNFTVLQPTATPTITHTPTATLTSTPTYTYTPTIIPTITSTPGLPDLIFKDGFESGNLSAWTSSTIDLGDLSVSAASALVGTQGMQAVIDDANTIYVTDDSPNAELRYRARFYFDPNSIPMASGDAHFIFKGFVGASTEVLRMEFRQSAGAYQIRAALLDDGTTWINTNWFMISDVPHFIELDWRAATGVGANNGGLAVWIDSVQQQDLTGIDNDTRQMDRARLGALTGIDAGTSGTYYFDAFESRRQTYIGP